MTVGTVAGGVGNEANGAMEEHFNFFEVIFPEGIPSGNKVNDRLGHASNGAKFDGAVEGDDFDGEIEIAEVVFGAINKFGGYTAVGGSCRGFL